MNLKSDEKIAIFELKTYIINILVEQGYKKREILKACKSIVNEQEYKRRCRKKAKSNAL